MASLKPLLYYLIILFVAISCKKEETKNSTELADEVTIIAQEKEAILKTLNNETKAAFQRDYDAWQEKWVHDPDITKIYLDFPENTLSESVGWEEISGFVKTFFKENPEPEPVPKLLDSIDVRLYGNGAWVTYEQQDSLRGRKRETRLMEKVNGEWKIAGMQTTIYGFKNVNETSK
ncbi:nuclear transport factor 2 family protein [Flagellimonas sp. 389]|uniref:nuclear transport factor 2 family protein n=1 Tax=Flagellimonas sp. 389 TaxID=2835862 RepID=UPI001BD5331B|nr:nuclear transport factor 2 family protein [Flagellimonas sp. 389]MBS9462339.1 nuclear transport factor 2 family protein [Flagellimonas sp. 389]